MELFWCFPPLYLHCLALGACSHSFLVELQKNSILTNYLAQVTSDHSTMPDISPKVTFSTCKPDWAESCSESLSVCSQPTTNRHSNVILPGPGSGSV
jgi:hypothetical protein